MVESSRTYRAAFLAMAALSARPAAAANTTRDLPELASGPFVFGVGQCPTPGDVESAALTRVPDLSDDVVRHRVRVEISDREARYEVQIWKDGVQYRKVFEDAARDCDKRVRFAAVFVILTIRPPAVALGEDEEPAPIAEPESPAPPPPPPPEPDPPPELEPEWSANIAQIELGATVEGTPRWLGAPRFVSVGGELRVALGPEQVAGVISVGYQPATSFAFETVEGDITRVPGTIGLRFRAPAARVEWALDVSGLVLLQRLRATNLLATEEETVLEFGARGTLLLSYRLTSAIAPFVGVSGSFVPSPREIRALPEGTLGNTPPLWLGATLGLRLGL
jgi:hypothetical protein